MKKKIWQKPVCWKIKLSPEEAVLTACKTGQLVLAGHQYGTCYWFRCSGRS